MNKEVTFKAPALLIRTAKVSLFGFPYYSSIGHLPSVWWKHILKVTLVRDSKNTVKLYFKKNLAYQSYDVSAFLMVWLITNLISFIFFIEQHLLAKKGFVALFENSQYQSIIVYYIKTNVLFKIVFMAVFKDT